MRQPPRALTLAAIAPRSRPCCRIRRRASGVILSPSGAAAAPKFSMGVCTSSKGASFAGAAPLPRGVTVLAASPLPNPPPLAGEGREGVAGEVARGLAVRVAAAEGTLGLVPPPKTATTVPTGTVAPAATRISESTPLSVAWTSIDTLSVSISKRFSPASTRSPTCLNQDAIFPSATVSPSWGMITSMAGAPLVAYQLAEIYCVSRNSISPSCAPSRPRPDCLAPPKGAAGSETTPRLRPTMPESSRSETRMPRAMSLV